MSELGSSKIEFSRRRLWLIAIILSIVGLTQRSQDRTFAADQILSEKARSRSVRLRFAWGGNESATWMGQVKVSDAKFQRPTVLGVHPLAGDELRFSETYVSISQNTPAEFNGFDIDVIENGNGMIIVEIADPHSKQLEKKQIPLSNVLSSSVTAYEDSANRRFSISRIQHDKIQTRFARKHLIFDPEEKFDLAVRLNQLSTNEAVDNISVRLLDVKTNLVVTEKNYEVHFETSNLVSNWVDIGHNVPSNEGVYRIQVEAWNNGGGSEKMIRELDYVVVDRTQKPATPSQFNAFLAEFHPASLKKRQFYGIDTLNKFVGAAKLVQGDFELSRDQSRIELPTGGWQLIALPSKQDSNNRLIEIEIPNSEPHSIGLSVLQSDGQENIPNLGFESGSKLWESQIQSNAPGFYRHQLVYWPSDNQDYLLITNRGSGRASFGRVRIFAGQPTRDKSNLAGRKIVNHRSSMAYVALPMFAENFGVFPSFDKKLKQPISDWHQFYQSVIRLVKYLKQRELNGCFLTVVGQGSGQMPLDSIRNSARFDTGVFSSTGRDPIRKDIVELIYRIFERENLKFVPVICVEDFARCKKSESQEPVREDPSCSLLTHRAQSRISSLVYEVSDRYQNRPNYEGLAMTCQSSASAPWSADPLADLNPGTETAFRSENPSLIGAEEKIEDHLDSWLAWRIENLHRFFNGLATRVCKQKPDSKLYVSWIESESINNEFASNVRELMDVHRQASQSSRNFDLARALLSQTDNIVWMRHRFQSVDLKNVSSFNHSKEKQSVKEQLFNQLEYPAEIFTHQHDWIEFHSIAEKLSLRNEVPLIRQQQLNPASIFNLKRCASSLHQKDTHMIAAGGQVLDCRWDKSLSEFMATFNALPAQKFRDVTHVDSRDGTHPIAVRFLLDQKQLWVYAVNQSPWQITLQIDDGQHRSSVRSPIGPSRSRLLDFEESGLNLVLEPFGLIAYQVENARGIPVSFNYQIPKSAKNDLASKYYRLRSCLQRCQTPTSISVLENPDFESGTLNLGWTFPPEKAAHFELIGENAANGQHSLSMHHSSEDCLWIRSNEFEVPESGQLSVLAYLKSDNSKKTPKIRISVEDSSVDSTYYRYAEIGFQIGANKTSDSENQLTDEWRQFAVHFNDLPLRSGNHLRIGFDLVGPGAVLIDQVELFDRWMDESDVKVLTQMFASLGPLMNDDDKLERCRQILDGYWPTYLLKYYQPKSKLDEMTIQKNRSNSQSNSSGVRASMRRRFRKLVSPGFFKYR